MDDKWFVGLAQYISTASKDPSTKVGAIIVDRKRRIVGTGFNGFPQSILDSPERLNNRELKYKLVIHAEVNAIIFSNKSVEDCTLYQWPCGVPCIDCAKFIIQNGIVRVVGPKPTEEFYSRWKESLELSKSYLAEAKVQLDLI